MTGDEDENTITAEDVEWANRTMLVRAAGFTRNAGTVLRVVGAVGAAAALWTTVRYQQDIGDRSDFSGEPDVTLMDRLDQFSATYGLLVAPVIGVAVGLALRLMADYAVVRVGGSLSGFEVGHRLPPNPGDQNEQLVAPVLPPNPGDYEPGG